MKVVFSKVIWSYMKAIINSLILSYRKKLNNKINICITSRSISVDRVLHKVTLSHRLPSEPTALYPVWYEFRFGT